MEVQLYKDVVKQGITLVFVTNTLLDIYKSNNYLEETSGVNLSTNTYFDITEVCRKKLESKLKQSNLTISDVLGIYSKIKQELEAELTKFKKKSVLLVGILKNWIGDAYVLQELGIDNFSHIDNTPKYPQADW